MCLDITDVMLIWASYADPKLIILSFRSFFFFFPKIVFKMFFWEKYAGKSGSASEKAAGMADSPTADNQSE